MRSNQTKMSFDPKHFNDDADVQSTAKETLSSQKREMPRTPKFETDG